MKRHPTFDAGVAYIYKGAFLLAAVRACAPPSDPSQPRKAYRLGVDAEIIWVLSPGLCLALGCGLSSAALAGQGYQEGLGMPGERAQGEGSHLSHPGG